MNPRFEWGLRMKRTLTAHGLVAGRASNKGWPTSSEVGNTNSTTEFAIPTAKAMGHPTSQITCIGALAVLILGVGQVSLLAAGKKVVVIGVDGMDARLTQRLMDAGDLPVLEGLRRKGGFKPLGTSIPPQSPVAWSSFITGTNPGAHGIFDFVHRHPEKQYSPFYSASETVEGHGAWAIGGFKLQLPFWPFRHKPAETVLRREGTPFWDYLDAAGIESKVYAIPANYPPSPSKHGHHCCLSGMGVPDLLGTYGTYQFFEEGGPIPAEDEGGGQAAGITFNRDTARVRLVGPMNTQLDEPKPAIIEFLVHRDRDADAAIIEIQNQRILLEAGKWSGWQDLDFTMSTPSFLPDSHVRGICRFYLQQVKPNFLLYVSPINFDPADPAVPISEPAGFAKEIAQKLGKFYTAGFQEDYNALKNEVFNDDDYAAQTAYVLKERLALLDYAIENYDDGLLFFYFSSIDLQGHMFWWDSDKRHPVREPEEAKKYNRVIIDLYRKMDGIIGRLLERYGDQATFIVMSDHGFADFRREFNLCTWLRDNGYIKPSNCASLLLDVDWQRTRAYGLGLNGLYLNIKGRERDGIVDPGEQRETLLQELVQKLEAVRDVDGTRVIRKVYRADEVYKGQAMALAPDLIVGYARDYRASWATTLGEMTDELFLDNDSAWSADHCMAADQVPGIVFSNRPILAESPSLIDLAPTILEAFGVDVPSHMEGTSLFRKPGPNASGNP